jgi:uncharacterized protein (DUF2384 family)
VSVPAASVAPQSYVGQQDLATAAVDHLAEWLVVTLGPRLTAFAAGAHTPEEVDRVAHGVAPDAGLERRLRNLYAVTAFLAAQDGPGSAHEWLLEPSAELDDRTPAALLHDGEAPEVVWLAAASPVF